MKLSLISLGCSKNLVDSENLIGILADKKGFSITNNIEESDIVLINTCGFIGDAKEESIQAILEIAEYKRKGSVEKIIVAGCLAQRYASELLEEIPEIDGIIGTGEIDKIEEIVDEVLDGKRMIKSESLEFLANSSTQRILTTHEHTAYLKIAEGCNRRCAYCIIPSLRGKLRSRTLEDIVEEARVLGENGVREINLLAQETTEYGIDLYKRKALPDVMREIAKIDDIKWIRTYYMFPNSVTDELIEVMKTEDKVCKYFDIPIQHISTSILESMKRGKTGNEIKELLYKIRREIPEATIRTTVIVGYPGETEEDFNELLDFIGEFKFDYVGVFKYSKEEGTVAHDLPNQVDEDIKSERWTRLVDLQNKIAEEKNSQLIGKKIKVMIDKVSSESEFMLEGRTMGQALEIDGKVLTSDGTGKPGEIVEVEVTQNFDYDLLGPIVKNEL